MFLSLLPTAAREKVQEESGPSALLHAVRQLARPGEGSARRRKYLSAQSALFVPFPGEP